RAGGAAAAGGRRRRDGAERGGRRRPARGRPAAGARPDGGRAARSAAGRAAAPRSAAPHSSPERGRGVMSPSCWRSGLVLWHTLSSRTLTHRTVRSPLGGSAMRIFVLGNASRPGVPEEAERLLPFLAEQCQVCVFDLRGETEL